VARRKAKGKAKGIAMGKDRLWRRLMELGTVGAQSGGGVTRFSFTAEERWAKDLVIGYMKKAGLAVREDAAGNVIGRREGGDPSAPVVMTGSHLDTVPQGGKFDGALGVLAAIEALQQMNEAGVATRHPIEVAVFTDEEGARFGFGMLGSRAMAGTLRAEDLTAHRDEHGLTIAQAMTQAGLDPARIGEAARRPGEIRAYVELHIEQATVLERHNLPVGVVSGIAGPLWLQFRLRGEAGHAGATPMCGRRDPLAAAARILTHIYDETRNFPNAVATVGKIHAFPGGINVIPGEVAFTLDVRDIDEAARNALESRLLSRAEEICGAHGIDLEVAELQRVAPAPCAPELMAAIEQACRKLGHAPLVLPSGAGHDGMQLVRLCPIGMIFVRSRNGISHSPEEWTSPEDCFAGASVLYHTLLALAEGRA
jgi:allantoate deiminase